MKWGRLDTAVGDLAQAKVQSEQRFGQAANTFLQRL